LTQCIRQNMKTFRSAFAIWQDLYIFGTDEVLHIIRDLQLLVLSHALREGT